MCSIDNVLHWLQQLGYVQISQDRKFNTCEKKMKGVF